MRPALRTGFAVVCIAACAIGLAWIVAAPALLVGNDTPQHLFAAYATNHIDDEAKGYARFFETNTPVTTHSYVELVRLLEPVLGWRGAHRASLVIIAELWAFAFVVLVLCFSRGRWPIALLGFPLTLQWTFHTGLYPFHCAVALALVALGVWGIGGRRPDAWLALLLALGTLCQPLPAALAGVGLVVVSWARGERAPSAWLRLVAAGAPALILAALTTRAAGDLSGQMEWLPLTDRVAMPFTHVVSGAWPWRAAHLALVVAGAAAGVVRAPSTAARALTVFAALLVTSPLVLPMTFLGWELAGARALALGAPLLVAMLPWERAWQRARARGRAPAALLAALLAGLVVGGGAAGWRVHRAMDEAARPAHALLDVIEGRDDPRGAFRQTLVLAKAARVDVAGWNPLLHIGQLYAIVDGGAAPWGQYGSASIHHLMPLPELPAGLDAGFMPGLLRKADTDDDDAHAFKTAQLGSWSRRFGHVLVVGRPGDVDALVARGWRVEARTDTTALLTFTGCRATVTTGADTGDAASFVVAPRAGRRVLEAEARAPDGATDGAVLEGLSCGPARLTVGEDACDVDVADGARLACER